MAAIINNSYECVTCEQPVLGRSAGRVPLSQAIRETIRRASETLSLWCERAGQRRRLMELDDRMLRDIGVDPATAYQEYIKPFWRP